MTCDHCATTIKSILSENEGLSDINVSYQTGILQGSFNPSITSKDDVINALNATGSYRVKPEERKRNYDLIILGGGELIQMLSTVVKYNIPITDLAENFYPYLTLGEGIKLAAIGFENDVNKLSCCAS